MGVLIEHLGGAFPTWLAPVQAVVLPVSEKHIEYARELREHLRSSGVRAELVEESSLNYRIRNAEKQKIPYLLVVGEREAESRTVAVRQHKVKEQRTLGMDEIAGEIAAKSRDRAYDIAATPVAPVREAPAASTEDRPY
jgi:threonyl-tRNA synthetase